jgi:uncharacterized membrane protein YkgB
MAKFAVFAAEKASEQRIRVSKRQAPLELKLMRSGCVPRRVRFFSFVKSNWKSIMNALTSVLIKLGLLKEDLDYHLLRASMVIIFLAFGYQKWFEYEAQVLIPYISNGPLIFWMYPVFGIRGASWFLGVSEWLIAAFLFLGFWNKKLGILGALGSCGTFVSTVTIIPFMPNGWDPTAGFPAMAGNVPFLMKDVVLLAVSIYLLKQDVMRVSLSAGRAGDTRSAADVVPRASAAAANR